MSTSTRRRILRPQPSQAASSIDSRKLNQRRAQLEKEQASLVRWMTRLKRAFHAFEKQQRKVARLEKLIARLAPS